MRKSEYAVVERHREPQVVGLRCVAGSRMGFRGQAERNFEYVRRSTLSVIKGERMVVRAKVAA